MALKKINFGRTTIARAKAAVKRHRAAKKKKGPLTIKDIVQNKYRWLECPLGAGLAGAPLHGLAQAFAEQWV